MEIIVRFWRCADEYQRLALVAMMGPFDESTCFACRLKNIETIFETSAYTVEMWESFLGNLGVFISDCSPDEDTTFTIINQSINWIGPLRNAFLADCIHLDDPLCQQLIFPAARDPECTYDDY